MTTECGVLITDSIQDYALAVTACEFIKRSEGLKTCYPVQTSGRTIDLLDPVFSYYGARVMDFAAQYKAPNPVARARLLQHRFCGNDGTEATVKVSCDATPEGLSRGVIASLASQLPLVFTESVGESAHNTDEPASDARPEHLIFVRRQSSLAVAAALYASITQKRLLFVDNVNEIPDSAEFSGASTAVIVDDFKSFTKPFLARLTEWRPARTHPGILTAYSLETFTNLIWRLLQHRHFNLSGHRSRTLKYFERSSPGATEPVEYSVINEHGNESHMHYGGEVLCGALAPDLRANGNRGFNCEWSCPHEQRHAASQLAVHYLSILSCSTFTLGDGLVPPEFSLILNFLNGWPISIVAPWQHAITTPLLSLLIDSIIQSGFTLGEITQCLNSVATFGSYPHAAYVLLGDPETVVGEVACSPPEIKSSQSENGIYLEFSRVRGRILQYRLPDNLALALLEHGTRPEVVPVCDAAKAAGIYFCFTGENGSSATNLLIFSEHGFPDAVFSLRIGAASQVSDRDRESVLEAAARIRTHRIFGVDPALLGKLEDSVLSLVRSQSKYPWLVEKLCQHENGTLAERVEHQLTEVRHALLLDLLRRSADRLWLSHHYSRHYPQGRHLLPQEFRRVCDFCGNETHCWRYEDSCIGLRPRNMVMCSRCGIIADEPAEQEIKICIEPVGALEGSSHRQRLVLHNRSNRAVQLSFFVQFHHWKQLGIESQSLISDAGIGPGGSFETEILLDFARPLPDYIHDLMVYVLTDRFDLYNAGQKVAAQQHGLFAFPPEGHHKPGAHHQHAPNGMHAGGSAHQHHGSSHSAHRDRHEDLHGNNALHHTNAGRKQNTDHDERFIVVVEPHGALYRYLQIAHRNFRTLVLSTNAASCLSRERKYNLSLQRPNATEIDRLIQCDTTNVAAMRQALEPWKDQIAGVVAGEDVFVSVSAALGRTLGFDYATPEDAVSHHLKSSMKRRFREQGVPTPRFFITRTFEEARNAWENLGRDCMVKMVDFASSLNVFHVTTFPELEEAWDMIANNRRNLKTLFPLSQEIILEEFVQGRELSIEGYVQGDRIVCLNFSQKITESSFVVVGHLLPAVLSQEEEQVLRHVAEQCVRATGMRNSVFHIEVHLRNGRPYVIECASRPPGQHMVELMYRSYGFDLMEISIALATGKQVLESGSEPKKHFAMLALYSQREGTFERLEGLEELEQHGGLVHIHLDVQPGDRIEPLSTFRQKCGFAILEDATAEGIRKKERWFREYVRLALAHETAEATAQKTG